MNQKNEMILNGVPLRTIITLAMPLMLGNLLQTLYNIIDAYWVGKLGSVEFASVSYVWPINFVFLAFSIGMTGAATSLISQSIGKNDVVSAKKIATHYFVVALLAGVFFALIGFTLTPNILRLMGAEGDLYKFSTQYLRVIFLEMPIVFIFNVYRSMSEGNGDTKSPTLFFGLSVGINMILDPIFIMIFGWGVTGAAIATVLSKVLLVGFMLRKMSKRDYVIHIDLKGFKPDEKVFKNLFSIGIPGSLGQTVSAIGFAVMNAFILSYGDNTVAAFGLGNRITSLVMMPAMGLGAALAAFVGQNIGAGQYARAKRSVFETMIAGFSLLSLGSVFVYVFRVDLIHLFINEPEVVDLSIAYMNVLCFVFPLMAVFQSIMGAFQGSGHSMYVLFMTLSRLWLLRIPMIVISGRFTNLGSSGIWYAMFVSNICVCIIGIAIILHGKWLKPTLKTA